MSDKSFKETIKDVELSSYRSTTKEGYVSLDPSKPLPHEFEEGKLSRYNDNIRQKYSTNVDIQGGEQPNEIVTEHEAKIVSQYADANDSVILNKTEFREILMSALNINNITTTSDLPKSNSISGIGKTNHAPNSDSNRSNHVKSPEIKAYENIASSPPAPPPTTAAATATTAETDDVIYLNQTIEKSSSSQTPTSNAQKKTNPISLDTPEVDKLLNEGNFTNSLSKVHQLCDERCSSSFIIVFIEKKTKVYSNKF